MDKFGMAHRLVRLAALLLPFTACSSDPGPNPSSPPTLDVPTISVPTISVPPITSAPGNPVPSPSTTQAPGNGTQYPLSAAEAQSYLATGITVVGVLPDGSEVRAYKTTTTVFEDQSVQKQVCEPEYDYATGETETVCRFEYVTEPVRVQKTVFQISSSFTLLDFPNALAAVSRGTGLGVTGWKTG